MNDFRSFCSRIGADFNCQCEGGVTCSSQSRSRSEMKMKTTNQQNNVFIWMDDIPAEVWKLIGRHGAESLASLFNRMIAENKPPRAWTTSVSVPIWKGKGDVSECTNYRPISLLCHTMKIFERILDGHLQSIANTTLNAVLPRDAERSMLSTAAGYSRRNIVIKTRKSIWRSWTWRRRLTGSPMKCFGVPFDRTRSLRHTSDGPNYQDTTRVVCCPAGISPSFHQGSALLPLLFILCMDTAMADIHSPHLWTLLYTDNILLTNEEHQTLNDQMQQWKDRLNENGLQLSLTKAEYMECGPQTIGTTIVDGQDL
ncbi:hypothetical protein PO909_018594 [Leuciscus waleckii]